MAEANTIKFIVQYGDAKKWCSFSLREEENEEIYKKVVEKVKSKFSITEDIFLYDNAGVMIEEDFIYHFLTKETENLTIVIRLLAVADTVSYRSTNSSFATISSTQENNKKSDLNNWIETTAEVNSITDLDGGSGSSAHSSSVITAGRLKEFLIKDGLSDIFKEYEENNALSHKSRRQLVNGVVKIMMDEHFNYITKQTKIDFAKAVIENFPKLRYPYSNRGGYETFYDPDTGTGFLAWRLRTVCRKLKGKRDLKRKRSGSENEKEEEVTECISSNKENEEAISYLQHTVPTPQNNIIIFEKMRETFINRQHCNENVLNRFPRFLDTPGLIDQDFEIKYQGNLKKFDPDKIANVYRTSLGEKACELFPDAHENTVSWSKTTRAFLALFYLLPSTAKGRKKVNRQLNIDNLIVFIQVGSSIEDTIKKRKRKQPFIIAQGANIGAIDFYYVVVDGRTLPPVSEALKVFDLLFKVHFVFNIVYDDSLDVFWKFIQFFYYKIEIKQELITPKMKELCSKLEL